MLEGRRLQEAAIDWTSQGRKEKERSQAVGRTRPRWGMIVPMAH